MMRFRPRDEPARFDKRCRNRGRKWLQKHPVYDRPHDYWSEFEPDLRQAFAGLCAYCVMFVMKGQTDHFIPVAIFQKRKKDQLAYEWDNFRYSEGVINQRKQDHLVLDPFDVRDQWFEIHLPSLQLLITDKMPARKRKKAEFTIEQLGLQNDEVVIRYRQQWFKLYQERKLTLEGLRELAPLLARAIEVDLARNIDWRKQE